jgi:hypothetical protein
MKRFSGKQTVVVLVVLSLVLSFNIILGTRVVSAADTEAVSFNVNASMADNLAALKGKPVTVHLASGQTITGIVDEVKGNLLHIAKLSQKEFYDALVAIDHISAIEAKVR